MDPILQTLLSWQFVLFSLAIATIMFVIRKVFEYVMSNYKFSVKESKLWRDLILPILPVFIGGAGALTFSTFPYPEGLDSRSSRFLFGIVAGLLSTLLYRVMNSLLRQQIVTVVQTISGKSKKVVNTSVITTDGSEEISTEEFSEEVSTEKISDNELPSRGQL